MLHSFHIPLQAGALIPVCAFIHFSMIFVPVCLFGPVRPLGTQNYYGKSELKIVSFDCFKIPLFKLKTIRHPNNSPFLHTAGMAHVNFGLVSRIF